MVDADAVAEEEEMNIEHRTSNIEHRSEEKKRYKCLEMNSAGVMGWGWYPAVASGAKWRSSVTM